MTTVLFSRKANKKQYTNLYLIRVKACLRYGIDNLVLGIDGNFSKVPWESMKFD